MKTRYYLILVLVAICSGIGTSFGQYPEHMPQVIMSLYTDKQNYGYNDTVIISGDIDKNDFKSLSWLDVEIRDPSGVIFKNDVIPINNTGHYTYKITISQNFTSGQYLVRVSNPYYHEADLGNSFYVNVGNQIMPKNDLGDGNVFNMQASDFGLPGDTIEIKGNLVTKDSIKIMLHDPDGNTRYSATTFADRNGEFTSQLKVPSNAVSGLWKIVGDSGIYHRELNFTVSGYSSSQTCYGFHCTQSNSSGTTTTWPNIHGNNSSTLQTPLKQFKSGIAANDVKCEQGLQLVFKAEDSSPSCVKPDTVSKLVERGWGMIVTAYEQQNAYPLSSSITVQNTNFIINYNIVGDGKILDAKMDTQSKSLILSLNTTNNGTLIISVPRALLDIKKNDRGMGEFYMLTDGQETTFKEIHTTPTDRIFSIPFQNGTKNIEIIATELI